MGDLDQENPKQQIEAQGQPEQVFADIKRFNNQRENSIEEDEGPLLMILSGTQRGVYGGGGVSGLENAGLTNAFKTVVGVSAGAPAVTYFLAGQATMGTSIFYEENVGPEFINLWAGENKSVVDINWIGNIFKSSHKKIDIEAFMKNKTDAYYAVTNSRTGRGELIDAKKLSDPIEGIKASAAIPIFFKDPVKLNIDGVGDHYVDGAVAMPFPVEQILEKVKPTSVLVFANRPKKFNEGFFSKVLTKYESLVVDRPLEQDILDQDAEFDRQLDLLKNSGVPYAVIWTDDEVGSFERRPEKLKKAAEDFRDFVFALAKN